MGIRRSLALLRLEVGALAFEVVGIAAEAEGIGTQRVDGVLQPCTVDRQLTVELGRHRPDPGGLAGVPGEVEERRTVEASGELAARVGPLAQDIGLGEVPVGGHHRCAPVVSSLADGHPSWASRTQRNGRDRRHSNSGITEPRSALLITDGRVHRLGGARCDEPGVVRCGNAGRRRRHVAQRHVHLAAAGAHPSYG